MPLLDHYRPPFTLRHSWRNLHSTWGNALVVSLNRDLLPPNYLANPQFQAGVRIESDVGTSRTGEPPAGNGNGPAVATAVWAPPRAAVSAVVDFTDRDLYEVRVIDGNNRLVAVIELVSPANKDRPAHRRDFYVKCASYLQERVALVMVDAVTERQQNLHAELMRFLEMPAPLIQAVTTPLYAVAYRTILGEDERTRLELWPEPLAVGVPLPTLPLWIAEDRAVPLDLEATYRLACNWLRIDLPPSEDQPHAPPQ